LSLDGSSRKVQRRLSGLAHGLAFGATLYGALLVSVILALPGIWSRRWIAAVVGRVARISVPIALWLGGVRVEGRGGERIAGLADGFILVANHASNLDPIALIRVLGRVDLAFVAKAETLRRPLFGRMIRGIGWFGVERESLAALKKLKEEVEARRRGGWVPDLVVFPEGTRSVDGRLGRFRIGPFLLAVQTGLPIVPAVIRGTAALHPRNALAVHPGTVRVDVGEPIFPPPGKVKAAGLVDAAESMMRRAEAIFRAVPDLNAVDGELEAAFAAAAPVPAAAPAPVATRARSAVQGFS
jgi:1-acyl-sn-glycerol-3-phosphate acyltransferase